MGVGEAVEVLQSDPGDCVCLGSGPQLPPSLHSDGSSHTEFLILCGLAVRPTRDCMHLSTAEVAYMFSAFSGAEPPVPCSSLCRPAFVLMW